MNDDTDVWEFDYDHSLFGRRGNLKAGVRVTGSCPALFGVGMYILD